MVDDLVREVLEHVAADHEGDGAVVPADHVVRCLRMKRDLVEPKVQRMGDRT